MNMVVAYDIADPRRLQRIAKVMKDYGLRVQKSIFEVEATECQFAEMVKRVETLMMIAEDGIKFFPLCGCCCDTVITFGRTVRADEQDSWLIV